MKSSTKKTLWAGLGLLIVVAVGTFFWVRRFHNYTPVEVALDLKAAAMARTAPNQVERFLEARYGPLNNPTNRQKAFLDFFNVGHIEGLYLLVNRMPEKYRAGSIAGMAQWVADYRRTMTPEEKESLRAHLQSDPGRLTLRQATSRYLRQDVYYRGDTAQVIAELMATLAAIQQPEPGQLAP